MADARLIRAVRAHLAAVPGLPRILWPNEAARVTPPFLVFDNGTGQTAMHSLAGTERGEYSPQVSVMGAGNAFTAQTEPLVDLVVAAFKANTIISDSTGAVARCWKSPTPDGGRPDGGFWRVDIALHLRSHFRL